MMIFMNEVSDGKISESDFKSFLKVLAPFAPHITEELYQKLTADSLELKAGSVHLSDWPKFDDSLTMDELVNVAVSFNGKGRGTIEMPADSSEEEVLKAIFDYLKFEKYIENRDQIKKVIFVPNRIINIITE